VDHLKGNSETIRACYQTSALTSLGYIRYVEHLERKIRQLETDNNHDTSSLQTNISAESGARHMSSSGYVHVRYCTAPCDFLALYGCVTHYLGFKAI
jgi:coproporphyrinogen III oxidase-like Fe-S oxidoreductase